jgi:Flp pilus assembly protein TadD
LKSSAIDEAMIHDVVAANNPITGSEFFKNLSPIIADKGDFGTAERLMRASILLNPHDPGAHKDFARILCNLDTYGEALKEINTSTNLDSTDADAFALRGAICEELKDVADAIASNERAIAIDKTFSTAYEELAEIYENEGMKAKAAEILKSLYATLDARSIKAAAVAAEIDSLGGR